MKFIKVKIDLFCLHICKDQVIQMESIKNLVLDQRDYFHKGTTLSYHFRKEQLQKFKTMLKEFEKEIYEALHRDLNKSPHETLTTELGLLHMDIDFFLKHLDQWMEPERVGTPVTHTGTKSYIYKEPYGVTLVIAPWNYPILTSLAPTIGAIAAGNTIVLKPSELTPASSNLLKKMIQKTYPESYFSVVEGAKKVSQQLLAQRFDYIFFTGSPAVGKIVMEKASKHLTPVTLELGGKSPAIVHKDAKIKLAAKRIVWGKFTNAGQTCVAPDYLYVHEKIKDPLIKAIKKQIKSLYGIYPLKNKNYVRIVHEDHYHRLKSYLQDGKILYGGRGNHQDLTIEPTLIDEISWEDPIMQEEIFGPILPILTFTDLPEVIHQLKEREKPLALYYFGENKADEQTILENLSFGGGCINDTLYHLANPHLPFGGVGQSGMGAYHGKYSFDTFTHQKSIMKQTTAFDIPLRYPGGRVLKAILGKIMK